MPNLREKMKQEMTLRGFSLGTQENYLRAVIKLNDYFNRNPAKLTTEEIKSFLLHQLSYDPESKVSRPRLELGTSALKGRYSKPIELARHIYVEHLQGIKPWTFGFGGQCSIR